MRMSFAPTRRKARSGLEEAQAHLERAEESPRPTSGANGVERMDRVDTFDCSRNEPRASPSAASD